MWISVIGPPSCKETVAKQFENDLDFKFIKAEMPYSFDKFPQSANLNLLDTYYRQALFCNKNMKDKDLITVGDYWSQIHVYTKVLHGCSMIESEDYIYANELYKKMAVGLEPPNLIIYLTSDTITVNNKLKLKNDDRSVEWVNGIINQFDAYVKSIRIPVVEVDGRMAFSKVWDFISFDKDQITSSKLNSETLWTRTIFRTGYV